MQRPVLPDGELRAQARHLYGTDPQGYELGRPDYPERVYEVLATRCGLGKGTRAVEIGPGTGRVTRHLVSSGARVLAVEPDPGLAAHLRESMDEGHLQVLEDSFEDARIADADHDLVVAAMAWHWVDQDVGLPKLRRIMRPGGWAAIWWTIYGDPSRPDPYRDATRHLIGPAGGPSSTPGSVPFEVDTDAWTMDLTARAGLVDVTAEVIPWTIRLDPESLRALYASTITIRRRPPVEREAILDRLVAVAVEDFGGLVERPFVTGPYAGRRAG